MALPTTFNELAICAGYGGLSMGLREAVPSARVVCNVEREASSVEILVARMQDGSMDQAPIWSDLCTFDGKPWRGAVDIITAGIPCQPWSLAGKQAGFDDERHLGEELVRVVSEVEPSFVFVENVSGFVRLGAPDLLGRLSEIGFDAEWGLFSASGVGATHRRQRFFLLAYRRGMADPERPRPQGEPGPKEQGPHDWATRRGGRAQMGHSPSAGLQEPGQPADRKLQAQGREGVDYRPEHTGRPPFPPGPNGDWSGIPEEFHPATKSTLRGVANGPSTVLGRVDQLRMLGNGVVPAQAAHAFRSLVNRHPTPVPRGALTHHYPLTTTKD